MKRRKIAGHTGPCASPHARSQLCRDEFRLAAVIGGGVAATGQGDPVGAEELGAELVQGSG